MKKLLIFTLIILSFTSCKKDQSPIEAYDLTIQYTGKSKDNIFEFIVSNDSGEPVWYWGYAEAYPIYQYALLRNTVWEKIGPGWCGTGLIQIQLDSGNSFTINIADPQEEETWRVGIVLMHSPYGDEEEIWSQSIR